MKSSFKYVISSTSILGLVFLIFSSIKWMYWDLEELLVAKILHLIGCSSLVLYFTLKKWRKTTSKLMLASFSISLIISAELSFRYY